LKRELQKQEGETTEDRETLKRTITKGEREITTEDQDILKRELQKQEEMDNY
jgi:hypothetical protein